MRKYISRIGLALEFVKVALTAIAVIRLIVELFGPAINYRGADALLQTPI